MENRSTLKFNLHNGEAVRVIGHVVNTSEKAVKKGFEIVSDVATTYANILNGLLTLAIKVGLFIVLSPYVWKFVVLFAETALKVGGGIFGG